MTHLARRPALLTFALALAAAVPRPAGAADLDHDGLDDALEDALLVRHAPVVLLHPSEPVKPSSAEWLLARAQIEPPGRAPRVLAASVLGLLASFAAGPAEDPAARLRADPAALSGDAESRDWAVYGHAYRAAGGGVLLQYWFLYPFNAAYGAFDHGGDWEHVTVRLGPDLRPEGAHLARHADSAPGPWFAWAALERDGDHPVIRAGRGTHASYASPQDAPFWDRVCGAPDLASAPAAGCTAWRTWTGGGVVNVGERSFPRVGFLAWPGRWGTTGSWGGDSASAPPPGPAFQDGWCPGGAQGACP